MAEMNRIQKTMTHALLKESIRRLQNYIDLDNQPRRKDDAILMAARTVAVNACRDTADFLAGEAVMISQADAADAIRREDEVPRLQKQIDDLRKLVAKKKLKVYDKKMSEPRKG